MIEDEIFSMFDDDQLWGVYDNATDKLVAFGTYEETVRMLWMTKDKFEEMLSRFENGERTFDILGKKLSVNIMIDGHVYRKKWREVSETPRQFQPRPAKAGDAGRDGCLHQREKCGNAR